MKNLTERLEQHIQSIREDKRGSKVDLQKLYKMVSRRGSSYIEKTIYEFFLKPLEKGIEPSRYINHLERINKNSFYLEMLKAGYSDQIKMIKRLKGTDKYTYNELENELGPIGKDNIYDWWYKYFLEDSPDPEISNYWYEGGFDEDFEDLIEGGDPHIGHSAGFSIGEVETIKTLISLFWDRVDRLGDKLDNNESQQRPIITSLYNQI